ncbi:hypothetical protein KUTeg_022645 [Tegillarca granosa]|uniref:Dynamin-binding protein n=1 Tax=Tegillarca granosa TaxID=220873 RepID=A0ABQ9E512_TEGGR|nr:hypothetical protein KUTeg_022645 [Tegillarca granosa]
MKKICNGDHLSEFYVCLLNFKMHPDGKEYINQYVRAVYDFDTAQTGEITLDKGDIIRVTSVIDDNWLRGKINNKEGNFPFSFVEKISIPAVPDGQKVFAATENFPAQQDGDLEFRKGEIIIGLQEIDSNWWNGKHGSHTGLFPLTHVKELDVPKALRERSKSIHSTEPMFAIALCDSIAQLDEELSFKTGDMITVTEVVDADWYVGELGGKSGMFLSSCVELIKDTYAEEQSKETGMPKRTVNGMNSENYNYSENENYKETSSSLVNDGHSGIDILGHNDGVIEQKNGINQTEHLTSFIDTTCSDSEITPYAKTLYPFSGESADELTFMDNEIVHLIQHIDDQWIEGEIDGRIGLFPASFVSIVVDCPYAKRPDKTVTSDNKDLWAGSSLENFSTSLISTTGGHTDQNHRDSFTSQGSNASSSSSGQKSEKSTEDKTEQEEEVYGLVLYNFNAETETDLTLHEGDTVVILKHIDDNWVKARNEHGDVGLCPVQFIEVIGASPDESPESETKTIEESGYLSQSDSSSIHPSKSFDKETNKKDSVPLKSKPNIAPKPALKPKPVIKPKPVNLTNKLPLQTSVNKLAPVSVSITKSESTHSLDIPQTKTVLNNKPEQMKRTVSANELQSDIAQKNLQNIPQLGTIDGNDKKSRANSSSDSSSTVLVDSNKTSDLDFNTKSKTNTDFSVSFNNVKETEVSIKRNSVSFPVSLPTAPSIKKDSKQLNLRRAQTVESPFKTGQSTFFVDNFIDISPNKPLQMRKPPPPPQRTKTIEEENFERKPSLRKAPPPRPTGPRLASAPQKVPLVPVRLEGIKRVPARPAPTPTGAPSKLPSRPAPVKPSPEMTPPKRPPPRGPSSFRSPPSKLQLKSPSDDLIDMNSPEEANAEIIEDLKKRIREVEQDLDKYKKSKEELQLMLQNVDENETNEIHDNVAFYDANISGMTEELKALRENLQDVCPKKSDEVSLLLEAERRKEEEEKRKEEERKRMIEMKEKRKEKRIHFIKQNLCHIHPEVDIELVLGNMEEIADVSQKLLTLMENGTCGKNFQDQIIGSCFLELAEDMKNVYAPYCRNHDEVISLLEKATEDDHKDKTCTLAAINAMADVATAINEYKRRKDLGFLKKGSRFKGRLSTNLGFMPQTKDETFDREEARFRQLEKIVKIFVRDVHIFIEQLQESVSSHECLVADLEDFYGDKIDAEVQKYQKVHRLVDGTFLPEFTGSVFDLVISPLNRLLQMFEAPTKASEKALQTAKNNYEALNAQLLDELPKMYSLSFQLLQDCIQTFVVFQREYSSKVLHEMTEVLDLPSLLSTGDDNIVENFNIKHVTQIDRLSLLSFIPKGFNPKMDIAKQTEKKNKRQSLDPSMTKVVSDRWMAFYDHKKVICIILYMNSNLSIKNLQVDLEIGSPQIDSQRVYIQQQYPPSKLYRVTKTYKPTDLMDVGVFEGDFVGVVQEKDPMGNKERWFVDNGTTKGFVPKSILVLQQSSPPQASVPSPAVFLSPSSPGPSVKIQPALEPTPVKPFHSISPHLIGQKSFSSSMIGSQQTQPLSPTLIGQKQSLSPSIISSQQPTDEMDNFDFALDEDMSPDISSTSQNEEQFYYAEYPFHSRSDNEVSLFEGQVVTVLSQHDQQGNTEWWYVDADGNRVINFTFGLNTNINFNYAIKF